MQQAEAAAWNIYAQLSSLSSPQKTLFFNTTLLGRFARRGWTWSRPRVAWRRFKPSALGEFIALGSTEAAKSLAQIGTELVSRSAQWLHVDTASKAGVVEASQMGNLLPPALPPVGILELHRLSLTENHFGSSDRNMAVGAEAVARLAASATAAVASLLHRIHTLLVSYSIILYQYLPNAKKSALANLSLHAMLRALDCSSGQRDWLCQGGYWWKAACPHGCCCLSLCKFHREIVTRCDKQFWQLFYF